MQFLEKSNWVKNFILLSLCTAFITTMWSCKNGSTPTSAEHDQVPVISPTKIEINVEDTTLQNGEQLQLEAEVFDQNDEIIDATVNWSSNDHEIAMISDDGLVTTYNDGVVTITASLEQIESSIELTIEAANVAQIEIEEGDMIVLRAGDERQLHVILQDNNFNRLTDREVSWSSTNTQYVTVSDSGLISAISPGSAIITASSEGQEDQINILVEQADASSYMLALKDLQQSVLEAVESSGLWWAYTLDVGNDGYLDVVVQHGQDDQGVLSKYPLLLYRNIDNTRFEEINTGIPAWGRVVVVEDYNSDGLDDLFFADHGEESTPEVDPRTLGTNQLLLQDGNGGFIETTSSALPEGLFYSHGACAGDITRDGAPDIIVTMLETEQVLINNGDGTFTVQNDFISPMLDRPGESNEDNPIDLQPWACGMGDFRNTGSMDVILSNDGYQVPATYGDGYPNPYQAVDPYGNSLPQSAKLLFNNRGSELEYLYPESIIESPWNESGTAAVGLNTLSHDFNRDGCLDFVVYSSDYVNAHMAEIYLGDCNGGFSAPQVFDLPPVDFLWEDIELADVDGDGYMDIVMSNNLADTWMWGGGNRNDMHVILENSNGNFSLREGVPEDAAFIPPNVAVSWVLD
jgi:hypothetical protein